MLRSKLLILKCIDKKNNIVNHMLNYMAFGMCLGSSPTNLSGRNYCDAMNKSEYVLFCNVNLYFCFTRRRDLLLN